MSHLILGEVKSDPMCDKQTIGVEMAFVVKRFIDFPVIG